MIIATTIIAVMILIIGIHLIVFNDENLDGWN